METETELRGTEQQDTDRNEGDSTTKGISTREISSASAYNQLKQIFTVKVQTFNNRDYSKSYIRSIFLLKR